LSLVKQFGGGLAVALNMRLVAQGFDVNRNGRVDDDLDCSAIAPKGAKVSVEQLAKELTADRVRVSDGAVKAGGIGKPAVAPLLVLQQSVNLKATEALEAGAEHTPAVRHQRQGSPDWQAAIAELREKLAAIRTMTGSVLTQAGAAADSATGAGVSQLAAINEFATEALADSPAGDGPAAKESYGKYYAALAAIGQLTGDPSPSAMTDALGRQTADAEKAVSALGVEKNRALDRAKILRAKAAAVPGWQKALVFGLIVASSHNSKAKALTKDATEATSVAEDLPKLAKDAYSLQLRAATTVSPDDAARLHEEAGSLGARISSLSNRATQVACSIRAAI
jgi:cystathionine beta-lyase/cystathionine gamma-synthase